MEEQEYFKQALSGFTYEAACGGAIRHLADLGYSVRQIMEQLSYPVPYERVQKTVWEHYIDRGVLLLEEPGKRKIQEKAEYVKEYNQYGKASFRRVVIEEGNTEEIAFKERRFDPEENGAFGKFFLEKCKENKENAYVLLDLKKGREGGKDRNDLFLESLQILDVRQRDYMQGLFGERKKRVYHRLNPMMQEIIIRLYESDKYHGICYFIRTEEKIIL